MGPQSMITLPRDLWFGGQCRVSEGELYRGCDHQQATCKVERVLEDPEVT